MGKYFEGWYCKLQNQNETIAFIPAIHGESQADMGSSIQIISNNLVAAANYPKNSFNLKRNKFINIGNSFFSTQGAHLDINTSNLKIQGDLKFREITPLNYDIMGPFTLVPFMECRHSVLSLSHKINGKITINGKTTAFNDDLGYIEGDRGHSFPSHYLWTQCSWKAETPCSLMLSVANIPFAATKFTGIIAVILFNGKQYRMGTYFGAKIVECKNKAVTIKQGKLILTAQLLKTQEQLLKAPVKGNMSRLIRESAACSVRYIFKINNRIIFDFIRDNAGFEYEFEV
ncbi:MAG: hypothetical protein RSB05_04780 [Clostridiales bacterium]